jgi:hypothetical protein
MRDNVRTAPAVELYIEELVLHGFAAGDRHRIGEAVEQELARLLAEQGLPASFDQSGETDRLDGGTFHIAPGARPDSVGAQVAQAVYGGLAK